jgi:DNA-binding beta-propeller fold protein YncE
MRVRRTCGRGVVLVSIVGVVVLGLVSSVLAVGGSVPWSKRYNGPSNGTDEAQDVAVSPDGKTVYVTGTSFVTGNANDYYTVAYNSSNGAMKWAKHYNGPDDLDDYAYSVAVAPGGARVYVTGQSWDNTTSYDYATVAYNASNGAVLWSKRYNGPGNGYDAASQVAASTDGTMVFVTGQSPGSTSGDDYATIAYGTTAGVVKWTKRYNGTGNDNDEAKGLAVAPGGARVYVTGESESPLNGEDYVTIAYNATSGSVSWSKRYNGPSNDDDTAYWIAASPDGTKVFVTGESQGATSNKDVATIAYTSAGGAVKWTKRYNGPGNGYDAGYGIAVSPDSSRVFVTGESMGTLSGADFVTLAYGSVGGSSKWTKRYTRGGTAYDGGYSVAVNPAGTRVFVTGESVGSNGSDFQTIAYGTTGGSTLWSKGYNGTGNAADWGNAVAVGPAGARVFVTGPSSRPGGSYDYATIAYNAA